MAKLVDDDDTDRSHTTLKLDVSNAKIVLFDEAPPEPITRIFFGPPCVSIVSDGGWPKARPI